MGRVWQTKNAGCSVWESKDATRAQESCAVHLENSRLRVSILPQDGGRIISLYDKKHDYEHIWTNRRTQRLGRYYGANYDDLSASGIEEAFPTVQPCTLDGVMLPFFGEAWSVPWEYEIETGGKQACVRLWCETSITPARLTKTFLLKEDGSTLVTEYRIENLGAGEFPYIFGVHPSVCITEDTSITVPQGGYRTGYLYPSGLTGENEFSWPVLDGMDLSQTRPFADNVCVNFYTDAVKEGCYGFFHRKNGCGLEVRFSPGDFKSLSLWLIYGGWRGHYCVMSEMFSCWPADLAEAVSGGKQETLPAGAARAYTVEYGLTDEMN